MKNVDLATWDNHRREGEFLALKSYDTASFMRIGVDTESEV